MIILDQIAQILETAALGTQGDSIFISEMPEEAVTAICVRGPLTSTKIDWNLPGYHKHPIQVIVRASTFELGDGLAQQVFQTLYTLKSVDYFDVNGLFAIQIKQVLPSTLPISYPRLPQSNGLEWSLNFDCVYVLPVG